jgi:hypothetical protein
VGKLKTLKNKNPALAVAKCFRGELTLIPIDYFLDDGEVLHPCSQQDFVYKNGIVIDETTGLWHGKGLCGEGLESLEETMKSLPNQTIGAWVSYADGLDVYIDDIEALMGDNKEEIENVSKP